MEQQVTLLIAIDGVPVGTRGIIKGYFDLWYEIYLPQYNINVHLRKGDFE